MTVGERIRKARKEHGLTQKLLGQLSGTSEGTVRQYEIGKRQPRIEQLQKIADALDVPIEEFLSEEPPPDRDYELLCDALDRAGISIEATGFCEGFGPDNDTYYVWPKDEDYTKGERPAYTFRELLQILRAIEKDADRRRTLYICQRLNTELF